MAGQKETGAYVIAAIVNASKQMQIPRTEDLL